MNGHSRDNLNDATRTLSELKLTFQNLELLLPTLKKHVTVSPKNPAVQVLETRLDFVVKKLRRPIGVCTLTHDRVAVSTVGDHCVRIFCGKDGRLLKQVRPEVGRPFSHPSDMVAIPDGRFAVRDHVGIQLFDEDGVFMNRLGKSVKKRCYGLTTDGHGHLITISAVGKGNEPSAVFIHVESDEIIRVFGLQNIIERNPRSLCRFLACKGNDLFIADLGLNQIYVINLSTGIVDTFGSSGKGRGQFIDPAGIAIDEEGFMIIVDAGNNRLQLYNNKREHLGFVRCPNVELKRPSGIFFDQYAAEPALYVLNLNGDNLSKFVLLKPNLSSSLSDLED